MDKNNYKDMWVYVEHDGKNVHPVALELCCEVRKLCDKSGDRLVAVVAGQLPQAEIEKLETCGVDGMIQVSGTGYERYNTEAYTNLFTVLCKKYNPSAVFVGGTTNGRDFAPRFAARLETGCTSDATELIFNEETRDIEFVEPAAGGKIMAVITIPVLRPQVGTIRPGTFKYIPTGKKAEVQVIKEEISFDPALIRSKLLGFAADAFDPELDIASSETIVCVGNGLKEESSLAKYRELAALLGGKLACTRPIVDRELLPYKLQVGQSGVMIKPKLYIGFGISGAVNHVTGVDAEKFIAVNKDPDAPIFNYCDYGIVGDMDEVCDAMIAALKNK
ncbi:MAG: electron transfer flavoprotein subunit alpha/FixB family protein [Candidatus Limivicinus sp.]|nr:electron transfer flavoprotein subunit alpha/FixB family protein [Candidatus Limivicinus sp.]